MASSLSSVAQRKVVLESADGATFEVEGPVAEQCQTIKHMMEDDLDNDVIPLPNVTGKVLAKVVEYCKKHASKPPTPSCVVDKPADNADEELKNWDKEFIKVDQNLLFDIMLAANYMDIRSLLDLTCQGTADMIKGMSPEEIRKVFNVANDFTPEEEAEVRKENAWAFEN